MMIRGASRFADFTSRLLSHRLIFYTGIVTGEMLHWLSYYCCLILSFFWLILVFHWLSLLAGYSFFSRAYSRLPPPLSYRSLRPPFHAHLHHLVLRAARRINRSSHFSQHPLPGTGEPSEAALLFSLAARPSISAPQRRH